jgi:light-regulated signal transduction histidine kinase (bacteriophytochrome)
MAQSIDNQSLLAVCDSLPVAMPGAIQPSCAIISVSVDFGVITHVSDNLKGFFEKYSTGWLGKTLREVGLGALLDQCFNKMQFTIIKQPDGSSVAVRRVKQLRQTIYEFKSVSEAEYSEPKNSIDYIIDMLHAPTITRLHGQVVRILQELTSFAHVMVYQFDEDWNGSVVAETIIEESKSKHNSYLGLRFPKQDVPESARNLYIRQYFRSVSDTSAETVAIRGALDLPLDLSHCTCRAISPSHLEYLRNMGVSASFSTSIIVEGKLWGLLAAHHHAPRSLSFRDISIVEEIGKLYSAQLSLRIKEDYQRILSEHEAILSWPNRAVHCQEDPLTGEQIDLNTLLRIFHAVGGWIINKDDFNAFGDAPEQHFSSKICLFLEDKIQEQDVYASNQLRADVPALQNSRFAGMLAIGAPGREGRWLIFFRLEERHDIAWGGDPSVKAMSLKGDILSPRGSFERWQEVVKNRSSPWNQGQILVAQSLAKNLFYAHSALMSVKSASQELKLNTLSMVLHDIGNAFSGIAETVEQLDRREAIETSIEFIAQISQFLASHETQLISVFGDAQHEALRNLLLQIHDTVQRHVANGQQCLQDIRISLNHMRELLVLQKSYARKGVVLKRTCTLPELVEESTRITRSVINARGTVETRLDNNVPRVRVDRSKTIQIITNLIKNSYEAWDARPVKSTDFHLVIRTEYIDDCLALIIEDNGTGFDVNKVDLLFNPKFSTKNRSSGVGLSSCKKLAEETGLTLSLSSLGTMVGAKAVLLFKREVWL